MIFRSLMNLTIVFALTAPSPSRAAASPILEIQSRAEAIRLGRVKEDSRYEQTRRLCENHWSEYGWILKESAAEMLLLGTAYAPAWARFFENRRIAPEVLDLLESDAFHQALLDCGSGSVIPKMAAADYAGKVVGLAGTYALWRISGSMLMRMAQLGRAGLVAQRATMLLVYAYTVHQGFLLNAIIRNKDLIGARSKQVVDQKTQLLKRNVSQLRIVVEDEFRRELTELESRLRFPDLPDTERMTIREKIERIRFALNANDGLR